MSQVHDEDIFDIAPSYGLPGLVGMGATSSKYWKNAQRGTVALAANEGTFNGDPYSVVNSQTTASDLSYDDFIKALNDWYSNVQTADQSANEIAQQNAQAAMDFNRSEREAAQVYNEYAYKHRYQWTYEDMKAAGINPVIGLASIGVGASPTSSPASTSAAQTFMRQQNALDEWLPLVQVIGSLVSGIVKALKGK